MESFFVAFAGLVDSYMVSSLGASAVAAVGLTTQPKFIGLSLFLAVKVAVSALVARRFGEKKRDDANRIMLTTFLFVLIGAILIGGLFAYFASPILHLCGSTADTHEDAVAYFRIVMGGMVFNCLQMAINSAQRSAGNTKITMRTNITSNTINIIGNYLLINGKFGFPALGIHGAALATVFGTVVACVMSMISIAKKDEFISIPYIIENRIKPCWSALCSLMKVGYSLFLEMALMRFGFVMTALMAADQGTDAMAAHQVAMNISSLSFSVGEGLQATAVALIGRSLGERNVELAKKYGNTCQRLGGIASVCMAVLFLFGGKWIYGLFFREEHIVAIGVNIMYVLILTVIFQVRQVVYTGGLRGAGDTAYTALFSTISVSVIRPMVSYVFGYVLGWGIVGVWMGIFGDQFIRCVLFSIRFKKGKWTQIKI